MDRYAYGWMDDTAMGGWTNTVMDGRIRLWMDGWTDGRTDTIMVDTAMDGWIPLSMDGWTST